MVFAQGKQECISTDRYKNAYESLVYAGKTWPNLSIPQQVSGKASDRTWVPRSTP